MTCKDCIHKKACDSWHGMDDAQYNEWSSMENIETICVNFQNKADVQEVKHGKWIGGDYDKCSVCGGLEIGRTDYCPLCGARMDGDKGGDKGGDIEKIDEFIKTRPFAAVDDWKTQRIAIIFADARPLPEKVASIDVRCFMYLSDMSREILTQKSTFAEQWNRHRKEILG